MINFKHYDPRRERATGYVPKASELEIDTELFLAELNGERTSPEQAWIYVHDVYVEVREAGRRLRATERKRV